MIGQYWSRQLASLQAELANQPRSPGKDIMTAQCVATAVTKK
jgi:hypothetical protein